jgi:hypothetical protein
MHGGAQSIIDLVDQRAKVRQVLLQDLVGFRGGGLGDASSQNLGLSLQMVLHGNPGCQTCAKAFHHLGASEGMKAESFRRWSEATGDARVSGQLESESGTPAEKLPPPHRFRLILPNRFPVLRPSIPR